MAHVRGCVNHPEHTPTPVPSDVAETTAGQREVCPDPIPVEHTRGHLPDHCPTCAPAEPDAGSIEALRVLIEQHTDVDGQEAARAVLASDWLRGVRAADARRCNERQRLSLNATLDRLIGDELDAGNTERAAALRSLRAWNRGAAYVIQRGVR